MKLLLDVHVPAAVIHALSKRRPGLDIQHLSKWRHGDLLEAEDPDILQACAQEERVWVTYDLTTVPDLLGRFAEEGRDYAGCSSRTMRPSHPKKWESWPRPFRI